MNNFKFLDISSERKHLFNMQRYNKKNKNNQVRGIYLSTICSLYFNL